MESNVYIEAYSTYREILEKADWFPAPLPFDKIELPKQILSKFPIYCMMLKFHANPLPNDINDLLRNTDKLSVWSEIIDNYDLEEKLELMVEFVEPIAFLTLNLPYAIKNRFIFSLTHLCHQANRCIQDNWSDDLPGDREIKKSVMEDRCSGWNQYANLKKSLDSLCSKKFSSETKEYRDKFHHRFPVGIEIGLSNMVNRIKNKNGSVGYGLGGTEPLSLKKIIPLLKEQFEAASLCYAEYRKIIDEQLKRIKETIAKHKL